MRLFIAGATGTLGRPAVRALLSRGHEVCGLTRTAKGLTLLEKMGATAVQGDALDAGALHTILHAFRPEVVVHLLTALPAAGPRGPEEIEATNVLRAQGTAHLLRAAIESGARRLVAESFAGINLVRPGYENMVAALTSLEQQLDAARKAGQIETVTLRFGLLYGPDVPSRQAPTPGSTTGMSFAHIDTATRAIVAAVEDAAPPPVFDVIDSLE